jgi:sugar/nucleoside kinase (ribokinase family)
MPDAPRVVVFGDVIDDIVAVPKGPIRTDTDTATSISRHAGGSGANAASWLASTGVAVDFIGRVGIDDVERHAQLLKNSGVRPLLIADDELPTGTIVVIVERDDRTFLTERGANAALAPEDIPDSVLAGARLLHFSGYTLFGSSDAAGFRDLFARAAALGVEVSVDPGSAGYLADYGVDKFLDAIAGASFFFPNLDEGAVLTGLANPLAIAETLSERFAVVALTMGSGGVIVARQGEETLTVDALDTRDVDPTGAGDAFSAGFLAAWIGGADAAASAASGALLAARAVTVTGGRPRS